MNKTLKALFNIRKKLVIREDKILPIDNKLLSTLKHSLYTLCVLNLERLRGIPDRLRIANNFVLFILKMKRNHGLSFTIKWLKASTVAFQKWLGKDIINSLRVIEPGLPLPRVINGCPAIISRTDRLAIRNGNIHLYRFWHSLFSIYRILDIPGKMKIETILSPFRGDEKFLTEICSVALSYKWPKFLSAVALNQNLAPRSFIFSSKASPSNSMSYQGILSDIAMLMTSSEGTLVFGNMMRYLSIIGSKWNTSLFLSRFNDGVNILSQEKFFESFLKFKNSPKLFGQLSIKKEAAGKIRVFALVDSVTQSVLKPLHLGLFNILRNLPNDGTFDQEASVRRCQQKALKYQCAYSFDLSAATDRLPVQLTGSIFESLFQLNGLGDSWKDFLVERDFAFPDGVIDEFNLNSSIPGFTNRIRYSVGQPMGALSSWAGLAITHHWIMQFVAYELFNHSNQLWEERYEILGDDIVIFDSILASRYLEVMELLGVDINLSKSIVSKSLPVFEFAKRTSINDTIVSGITLSQIRSGVTLSSRVANLSSWVRNGLILAPFIMEFYLGKNPWLKEVGSLALFNIFKKNSREEVIDALVNPKYGVEFNMEDHEFGIPCRQLLTQVSNMVIGADISPLSKSDDRREWTLEMTPEISAEILKVALFKIKGVVNRSTSIFDELTMSMVDSSIDPTLLPSLTGWVEDCYLNLLDDKTNDPYELEDLVEGRLVYHAKTQNVSLDEAYELLSKVEKMDFLFSVPEKRKIREFDDLSNPLLSDVIRGPFSKSPNYWDLISLNSDV